MMMIMMLNLNFREGPGNMNPKQHMRGPGNMNPKQHMRLLLLLLFSSCYCWRTFFGQRLSKVQRQAKQTSNQRCKPKQRMSARKMQRTKCNERQKISHTSGTPRSPAAHSTNQNSRWMPKSCHNIMQAHQ